MIASSVSVASVSVPSSLAPRVASSSCATAATAAAQRGGVRAARLADPPIGGERRHPQARLHVGRRRARLELQRDRRRPRAGAARSAGRAAPRPRPGRAAPRRPRAPRAGRGRRPRPRGPRPAARPTTPPTPRPPRRRSTASGPCSSASFSSSRRSRCWRSPTCATSARAAEPSSRTPSRGACSITQRGRSLAFCTRSATTSPPAAVTAACSAFGACARLSSAAKNATVVSGGIDGQHGRELALHVGVAPALDALDDDEAPSHRERHRVQRQRDGRGRRLVALEHLDAARRRTPPRRPCAGARGARRRARGRRRGSGRRA